MSWPIVALSDLFDIARGGSPRPIQKYITEDPSGVNWIMIGDASEGTKYISETKKRIIHEGLNKTRQVHVGDFLLTNSMSFGKPYILKTSGCIHDGWLVLRPRSENVLADYFYYLLGSKLVYAEFTKRAAGAVVKNLNTDLVKNVKIPLPPIKEQKRIAAILDAADELRTKRRESIAQLDALLQSTFLDMFGDPVTNPKGWNSSTLEAVTHKITDGTHKTPKYTDQGIEFLSAKDLKDGGIVWDTGKFISPEEHRQLIKRCNPEMGDLVLAKSGSLGSIAIIDRSHEFSLFESLCLIKHDEAKLSGEFLMHMIRNPRMQAHLLGKNKGVAIKHLHLVDIRSLRIILPPLEWQAKFSAFAEQVRNQCSNYNSQLTELDNLFASLQSRAFRGEL